MSKDRELYIGAKEVAKHYDVKEATARDWMREGKIPAKKIVGSLKTKWSWLETWEEQLESEGVSTLVTEMYEEYQSLVSRGVRPDTVYIGYEERDFKFLGQTTSFEEGHDVRVVESQSDARGFQFCIGNARIDGPLGSTSDLRERRLWMGLGDAPILDRMAPVLAGLIVRGMIPDSVKVGYAHLHEVKDALSGSDLLRFPHCDALKVIENKLYPHGFIFMDGDTPLLPGPNPIGVGTTNDPSEVEATLAGPGVEEEVEAGAVAVKADHGTPTFAVLGWRTYVQLCALHAPAVGPAFPESIITSAGVVRLVVDPGVEYGVRVLPDPGEVMTRMSIAAVAGPLPGDTVLISTTSGFCDSEGRLLDADGGKLLSSYGDIPREMATRLELELNRAGDVSREFDQWKDEGGWHHRIVE